MTLPFENDTSAVIRKLTKRSLTANKKRNFFLVVAIMLTTLLIGSVFSVGISLVESVKIEQTRLAGTMAHVAVGHPTTSQIEKLHTLDYVEKDGSVSLKFIDEGHISEYCNALVFDLGLSENQPIATVQLYDTNARQEIATLLSLCAVAIFLIFISYLLIYNILYISISRDVQFYGLLKTLGATPKQIRRVVRGQILRLCLIGIPIGILLSLLVSFGIVPSFISALGAVSANGVVVSFSPIIYVGAIIFPLLTAILGALKPARKAASISPIEAQKYTGVTGNIKGVWSFAHGKLSRMALRNIFRDKQRAGIVLFSLFLGVTTFLTVTTLVFSTDVSQSILIPPLRVTLY